MGWAWQLSLWFVAVLILWLQAISNVCIQPHVHLYFTDYIIYTRYECSIWLPYVVAFTWKIKLKIGHKNLPKHFKVEQTWLSPLFFFLVLLFNQFSITHVIVSM